MHASPILRRCTFGAAATMAVFAFAAAGAQEMKLQLTGDAEVPPVTTSAKGEGTFNVAPDNSITGSVRTTGMEGTMAHLHEGAAGSNGPVRIPLTKQGDQWVVPPGTKLDDAQRQALKAGKLYVNVHSAKHPGGELRAQLAP